MKRFMALAFMVLFCFTIAGCGSSEKTSEVAENESVSTDTAYTTFRTKSSQEYTDFLEELDCSMDREFIAISNSSYAGAYSGPVTLYSVIYKVCDNEKDVPVKKYEYSVFEKKSEEECYAFLDTLGAEYEVVDISITSYAFGYSGPEHIYIVTYRKALS